MAYRRTSHSTRNSIPRRQRSRSGTRAGTPSASGPAMPLHDAVAARILRLKAAPVVLDDGTNSLTLLPGTQAYDWDEPIVCV
jgi:hypothetical protein